MNNQIQPWKKQLADNYTIDTIDPLNKPSAIEDAAALAMGRFIRAWFVSNPSAQSLMLRRNELGIPEIQTGNYKELSTSFSKRWSRL